MTSVLISIKPHWCELIANGQKTIEIRKTRPKLETPFKVYIYCTRAKIMSLCDYVEMHKRTGGNMENWCGKVIGEFVCNEIVKIFECCDVHDELPSRPVEWWLEWDSDDDILSKSCLSHKECLSYLGKDGVGYGWYISNLKIYDEPKILHHFFKPCGDCDKKGTKRCTEESSYCRAKVITRPPQSWRYVEEV